MWASVTSVAAAVTVATIVVMVRAPLALAQTTLLEQAGFAISPPTAFLRIKPGSQATHTITIENTSQATLSIQPDLVDFTADGSTGNPVLQDTSVFPYLSFIDGRTLKNAWDPVILKPGQKAQLTIHIAVPPLEPEKEWPLTLLFKSQPVTETSSLTTQSPQETTIQDSQETSLRPTIGSNLIVLVSNQETLTQHITLANPQSFLVVDSFKPLALKPSFKNMQFAATVSSGSAVLKNWSGTAVATQELYPEIILGHSSKTISGLQRTSPANGAEQATLEKVPLVLRPAFLFGLYTLEYVVYSPTGERLVLGTATIIALPIFILGALIAIATVATVAWLKQK